MTLLNACIKPETPSNVFIDADGLHGSYLPTQLQADLFWKWWHSEYLTLLQKRRKYIVPQKNLKPNSLVLIKDDKTQRCTWPRGIVKLVIYDCNTICLRAVVRTADGKELPRDIRKLCVLKCDVQIFVLCLPIFV